MDKKLTNVLISLVVILVIFAIIMFALGNTDHRPLQFFGGSGHARPSLCVRYHRSSDRFRGVLFHP